MVKILLVSTSANAMSFKDKSGAHETGVWLEECVAPYFVFTGAGHDVTLASVEGGDIPVDKASTAGDFFTSECQRFMNDSSLVQKMKESVSLSSLKKGEGFEAVFFAGGHGTYTDFVNDTVKATVEAMFDAGKVVGAVCHGPIALVNCVSGGAPLVKNVKMTGFTDSEETAVGLSEKVPFLLESKLKQLGAVMETGPDWGSKAVTHKVEGKGTIVTGQNPASSTECAKAVLAAL
eukprot:GSMAST32.ASY1.ANO1.1167.1 assembled CDS